jgi:hypothetical protein
MCCALAGLSACGGKTPRAQGAGTDPAASLLPLRAFEEARRQATDFARLPPGEDVLGANPYAVRALPGTDRFVSILRGSSAIVVLDASLHEVQRSMAPSSPSGLAISSSGEVLVVGEHAATIARFGVVDGKLVAHAPIDVKGVKGLRDVAIGPEGTIHVLDEHEGTLVTLVPAGKDKIDFTRTDTPVGHGPIHVVRTPSFVVVDALLDHSLVTLAVDEHGVPRADAPVRIQHDGPIWSFDALEHDGALTIAAGGVEDHPLDRTGGFFGYIDSFFFVYEVAQGKATRVRVENLSAVSVITPKAIALQKSDATFGATVIGYGGEQLAKISWTNDGAPKIVTEALPPGGTSFALTENGAIVVADPLLDAFLRHDGEGTKIVPVDGAASTRSSASKVGEALFFTSIMAPRNSSDGAHSRFTCETCHFEGQVDGRTHHTGRGDVHATTKPLVGLFNNKPHFTRALDPDLTTVVHNEFRVAGAASGTDPWFTLQTSEHGWVSSLGVTSAATSPVELRRALMSFLMEFTHGAGPSRWATPRTAFDAVERKGAELFRDTCASCHAARLVTDDPSSDVPFARWESLVFSDSAPLVWASAEYRKTGIIPYVHDKGARTPSLRRLWKKYPYFTNGSANSLENVLSRVRLGEGGAFFHDATGVTEELRALPAEEQLALRKFLELL